MKMMTCEVGHNCDAAVQRLAPLHGLALHAEFKNHCSCELGHLVTVLGYHLVAAHCRADSAAADIQRLEEDIGILREELDRRLKEALDRREP